MRYTQYAVLDDGYNSTVGPSTLLGPTIMGTPLTSGYTIGVGGGGAGYSMAVLASSTITNTGNSVITGDIGLYPGTSITGFPPGTVSGTIHDTDSTAQAAQVVANNVFIAGNLLTPTETISGDLGGLTLGPGVYHAASSIGITGTLTLNGYGNPNATWAFQIGSTLTTASTNSTIVLENGASAANIFWYVGSSATLGTSTTFVGNIVAQVSISLVTGAAVDGVLWALTGAVTLEDNAITASSSPTPPAVVVSKAIDLGNVQQFGALCSFETSSTLVGNLSLQVCDTPEAPDNKGAPNIEFADWLTMTVVNTWGDNQVVAPAPVVSGYNLIPFEYSLPGHRWIRFVFTGFSGTGTVRFPYTLKSQ